jgi:hypothetical protein
MFGMMFDVRNIEKSLWRREGYQLCPSLPAYQQWSPRKKELMDRFHDLNVSELKELEAIFVHDLGELPVESKDWRFGLSLVIGYLRVRRYEAGDNPLSAH